MKIPYITFGEEGRFLHFAHANGYPPKTYTPFLEHFASDYRVVASSLRPLWPGADPEEFSNWSVLGNDLLEFLEMAKRETSPGQSQIIGVGHSVGAAATLIAALERPELFQALVLVEPVIFLPWMSFVWRLVTKLGLQYRFHPLIKGALKRRDRFPSREAMYENYRSKSIFNRISDRGLHEYVNALARVEPNGEVTLTYSPAWEARIYATAGLYDPHTWRLVPKLNIPTLLVQGAHTDTFRDSTAQRLLKFLPRAELQVIPEAGHLAPLEAPENVFRVINSWLGRQRLGEQGLGEQESGDRGSRLPIDLRSTPCPEGTHSGAKSG